mmetsp:Transcript_10261/g.22775  ORF Transcript_10261/g.22775 Transcript_10261/m.22775 type:complete len:247 (+) Transcript_10261:57-797(+)
MYPTECPQQQYCSVQRTTIGIQHYDRNLNSSLLSLPSSSSPSFFCSRLMRRERYMMGAPIRFLGACIDRSIARRFRSSCCLSCCACCCARLCSLRLFSFSFSALITYSTGMRSMSCSSTSSLLSSCESMNRVLGLEDASKPHRSYTLRTFEFRSASNRSFSTCVCWPPPAAAAPLAPTVGLGATAVSDAAALLLRSAFSRWSSAVSCCSSSSICCCSTLVCESMVTLVSAKACLSSSNVCSVSWLF